MGLTKCVKMIYGNDHKMKYKKIRIARNDPPDFITDRLKEICAYLCRMESCYAFLSFLWHTTKYRHAWVIEEVDNDFTVNLDEIEEEIVTPQYLAELILKIKYPTAQCIQKYYESTSDQFDENKKFPMFEIQMTAMRNQIILHRNKSKCEKNETFQ